MGRTTWIFVGGLMFAIGAAWPADANPGAKLQRGTRAFASLFSKKRSHVPANEQWQRNEDKFVERCLGDICKKSSLNKEHERRLVKRLIEEKTRTYYRVEKPYEYPWDTKVAAENDLPWYEEVEKLPDEEQERIKKRIVRFVDTNFPTSEIADKKALLASDLGKRIVDMYATALAEYRAGDLDVEAYYKTHEQMKRDVRDSGLLANGTRPLHKVLNLDDNNSATLPVEGNSFTIEGNAGGVRDFLYKKHNWDVDFE